MPIITSISAKPMMPRPIFRVFGHFRDLCERELIDIDNIIQNRTAVLTVCPSLLWSIS